MTHVDRLSLMSSSVVASLKQRFASLSRPKRFRFALLGFLLIRIVKLEFRLFRRVVGCQVFDRDDSLVVHIVLAADNVDYGASGTNRQVLFLDNRVSDCNYAL